MSHMSTIGLEIHIELKTKTKMFCRCINDPFCRDPNIHICPVCLGLPGALPFPNQQAVLRTIQLGKALNCQVASQSKWDRKHYFYPDLPKGYQISQYDLPLCRVGHLDLALGLSRSGPDLSTSSDGSDPARSVERSRHSSGTMLAQPPRASSLGHGLARHKRIRIRRIHLEEDTGKLLHTKDGYSLVDYNRAGVPLLELVTEPDIESAEQAKHFAQEIQLILRHLEISQADMEKGEMRVEANVSLASTNPKSQAPNSKQIPNPKHQTPKLGTKVEIKNLNSFRAVERAIEYEIKRQSAILKSGQNVIQETRGWSETKQATFSQRVKETEGDYRYFPEPDIPPLKLKEIKEITGLKEIGTLEKKRQQYLEQFALGVKDAELLIKDQVRAKYFKRIIESFPKLTNKEVDRIARMIIHRPLVMNREVNEVVAMSRLSDHQQKLIIERNMSTDDKTDFKKGPDDKLINKIVDKIIHNNQRAVEDYRSGKEAALGFLIGQFMKESKGRYEPSMVREMLIEELNE